MTAPPIADRCEMCERFGRARPAAAGSNLCANCGRWKQQARENIEGRIVAKGGSVRGFEKVLDAGAGVAAQLAMIGRDCGVSVGGSPADAEKQDKNNKGAGQ